MNEKFKIACYGYLEKDAGSLSGANFLVIEELLNRGYQIDFYNHKDFVYPQELFKYKNFNYYDMPRHQLDVFLRKSARKIKSITPIINLIVAQLNFNIIRNKIIVNKETQKYDIMFFLGCYSKFKIEEFLTVSWVQGPPHTERYFNLRKLKNKIVLINGITLYIKLLLFYVLKAGFLMPKVEDQDLVICGSQWSKEQIISYGFKRDSVKVLPYPIDLNLFQPNKLDNNPKLNDDKVFLWLGRTDPRKRLDLLLEAFALVLKERQDVKLKIFSGFPYAKGYKKLIDNFEYPDRLEYQPFINRLKIPELMSQCNFLIQPSEGENFGFAVAEAHSCGLPVIVGSTNGTKDYISTSSFVFEYYEINSLKETIIQAVKAREKNKDDIALDARITAEKNFAVSEIVDNLESIFYKSCF